MFKSIQESVKSLLSHSTNDKKVPTGTKRKHNLTEDPEDEDPDVQIIKVEKRRKIDTYNTPFWNLVNLPSKMANWVRLKSKVFSDQFENVDMSRRHGSRDAFSGSKRNGVPTRTTHNRNRGRPDVTMQQSRSGYTAMAAGHDHVVNEGAGGGMMNPINSSQINGERRSSTSSYCRQGFGLSTGMSSIRLKEREEYEKLLKLQSRLSSSTSPSRVALEDKESDAVSGSSTSLFDVSVLGNKSVFSPSRQSSTLISSPRSKPIPTRSSVSSSQVSDISDRHQKFNLDGAMRNRMSSLITQQKRQAELILLNKNSSQTQVQPVEQKRYSVESRGSTAESKSSQSKDSVVVIDDDDDDVLAVESDKGTTSSEINKASSDVAQNVSSKSQESQHKNLDFRDSVYMKPHYMEKTKHSRLMHCEQWRRQVQEEQMKAKAYEQKALPGHGFWCRKSSDNFFKRDLQRRAQNLELEKRLKYQMRIFEQEPEVSEEIFIEKEEEEVEEVLPELTESMMKLVRSALAPGNPGEILSDAFRLQITRKDISTLAGLNWLNDEVINFYMNMLIERGEQEGMSKVYAFNTFFYPKIMQGGHGAVKRWTKKVDIFAMHYILIPVHLGMHWCLCVANMKDKKITYYDSMHGRNKDCLTAVLKYINDESVAKKQRPITMKEWNLEMAEDNPQQLNGSDCGMFSCKYAEYITRGSALTFTQEDMPYFRHRMVYEIISKKLLQ